MSAIETRAITSKDLGINARARYLQAKQMFQTVDASETPNSQVLIDAHEQWLKQELDSVGIDATQENLYVVFRDVKVPDKKDKPAFRRIKTQVRASTDNILQGLLWYEAPEFASWNQARLKFVTQNAIVSQSEAVSHMRGRSASGGWRIQDWNSQERYKSLIVGYNPLEEQETEAPFTFVVNEHHPGVQGSFDYTDSKRKHIGVKAFFNPDTQLFEVAFEGNSDFIGWDQAEGEDPIYRLAYVREMVKDLYSRVKSGGESFVKLSKWRAY